MKKILIGLAIVLLAFFIRFNNLNWDSNFHLHPDERFLTMVGNAMKLPTSINQYFDQKTSLMNPANIGYTFFVYGRFPLILTKYLAVNFNQDNYDDFTILGRQLSALVDLLIVILVFKTVFLLEKKYKFSSNIKYWSAFFYAISVLPIQLSHFFAVDTFLNFFMFGSFYFALRFYVGALRAMPLRYILLSAIFFGLALACKVTALFILPLNLFFVIKTVFVRRQSLFKAFGLVFIYLLFSYFILRLADPYFFQNPNFINPQISQNFISNLISLKDTSVKDIMHNWFPPSVQWLNKNTVIHSLVNNIVFGMGIPASIFILVGIGLIISKIPPSLKLWWASKNQKYKTNNETMKQWNNFELIIILIWFLGFFVYQSLQTTPNLRYFIIIYPFLAIFAAIGISELLEWIAKKQKNIKILNTLYFILTTVLLIWPLMFSSIYLNKHTRVEASLWIYKNISNNSKILGESWDDPLPLSVSYNFGKQFTVDQLPVFDPDTPEKWQKMNTMLGNADYYVLSSNRGWGSIQTVPEKYPLMSKFYHDLLANKNPEYKKIKEFKPYYYRFFELPNNLVDESFTVYDHPTVLIFKNEKKP